MQQDRFDIVLEEDARDDALADLVALLGHGVLIGEKRGIVSWIRRPNAVNGGHDGHEVLELVEVCSGEIDCTVERIFERRVKATKGQLVDDVREIEVWMMKQLVQMHRRGRREFARSSKLTVVVEVFPKLHISMASCSDVEITLHLVQI